MKPLLRWLLALLLLCAGTLHLFRPGPFVKIVPGYLPAPLLLVYLSGVAELVCGVGLLVPAAMWWAAWLSVLLFLAVFPANLYMAMHAVRYPELPAWVYWARLPLQGVLIAWAWWLRRP